MQDPKEGISRRSIFQTVSAASLAMAAAAHAEAPPQHEVKFEPLPTFKYNIESNKGWVGDAGSAKEATVAEFPISQSIAGVSMRLKPGAIRELHWHSLAAEWAYVLDGRVRATVIGPNGQSEISDFQVGDTWYFPRGHGHLLQGLGPGEAHFLLGFDNGHFSEFGTFGITDWIANTSPEILAHNFGLPLDVIKQFPKKEIYIGPGKVPANAIENMRDGALQTSQFQHKYRLDQQPPKVFPGGREFIVSQKEFPIQSSLTAARMDLQPGAMQEMHWHPHADEWQYYVRGRSRITVFGSHGRVRTEEFGPGDVGFIQQGFGHYVEQIGTEPTEILILFNSPEYQAISLNNWLGGNPTSILIDNFGLSKEMVDRLPKRETGILGKRA
jgi:oxalate decarboxylase